MLAHLTERVYLYLVQRNGVRTDCLLANLLGGGPEFAYRDTTASQLLVIASCNGIIMFFLPFCRARRYKKPAAPTLYGSENRDC